MQKIILLQKLALDSLRWYFWSFNFTTSCDDLCAAACATVKRDYVCICITEIANWVTCQNKSLTTDVLSQACHSLKLWQTDGDRSIIDSTPNVTGKDSSVILSSWTTSTANRQCVCSHVSWQWCEVLKSVCALQRHLSTFGHALNFSQRRWDRNVGTIWKWDDMFRQINGWNWVVLFQMITAELGDSPPPGWEYSLQGESSGRL